MQLSFDYYAFQIMSNRRRCIFVSIINLLIAFSWLKRDNLQYKKLCEIQLLSRTWFQLSSLSSCILPFNFLHGASYMIDVEALLLKRTWFRKWNQVLFLPTKTALRSLAGQIQKQNHLQVLFYWNYRINTISFFILQIHFCIDKTKILL